MKNFLTTATLLFTLSQGIQAETFTTAGLASNVSTPANPNSYRITDNLINVSGAVWSNTLVDLNSNSFMISYDVNLGSLNGGGDGIAFVLQPNQPSSTLVGNNGEALGFGIGTNCYANINSANCAANFSTSLGITFDTYPNTNQPIYDHIALVKNGDTRGTRGFPLLAPAVQMHTTKADVEDNLLYNVMITWDHINKTLAVDFDGSRRITFNNDVVNTIFGGNGNLFWGITGSTGDQKNLQEIFNLTSVYFGPLPVQMSSFNINKTETNAALLNWSTSSERNNNYFTVERSADAKNFEAVTKVKAAGNTTSNKTYSAIDAMPLSGLSYYRIKQTDFDGKSSYSNVLPFENNKTIGNLIDNITLYPVPASSEINIDFASESESLATIYVYDVFGKQMIVANQNLIIGGNTITLDILELTVGTYFVNVVNTNGVIIKGKQFNKLN